MLWPVVLLNYLDRQMLSTIRVSIRADIPTIANDQDYGSLMAVFMWVYAALSPIGGYFADKFNRRNAIIGSLFAWSAVTWTIGHATTFKQLILLRALMGVSEAFYMPAALALITDFHTGPTRARAVGIHLSGLYAGLILGGIGGYIAQTSSWRNCFTWFGTAGIVYAFVLVLTLRDAPVSASARDAPAVRVTALDTLRALWSSPPFWILACYFTLPAIAGWEVKNWLPTYLADTFHLKQGPAGLSASAFVQTASFAGLLLGGALADAWMQKNPRGRINTSALGMCLMVPALLGIAWPANMRLAILCMILFGIGWGFFDCNNMPILCQIAAPRHRATGYGFLNCVSFTAGAGATIALGWMRDHGVGFSIAFAASAGLAIFSAILVQFIKPRISN
jgi:MFS family permease